MRILIAFFDKSINRLSVYWNRILLLILGIKHGANCRLYGRIHFKLSSTTQISIGENFCYTSGWNINPLCSNRHGSIYGTQNAIIKIGNNVEMSSTIIWCHKEIEIGNNVKIGGNCTLIDTDSHHLDYKKRRKKSSDIGETKNIHIEDDVWIGMNTIILKGVRIGKGSVIGANSVVTKNIPSNCIAAGNPAKILREIG